MNLWTIQLFLCQNHPNLTTSDFWYIVTVLVTIAMVIKGFKKMVVVTVMIV